LATTIWQLHDDGEIGTGHTQGDTKIPDVSPRFPHRNAVVLMHNM
jgi:hypothetical protein